MSALSRLVVLRLDIYSMILSLSCVMALLGAFRLDYAGDGLRHLAPILSSPLPVLGEPRWVLCSRAAVFRRQAFRSAGPDKYASRGRAGFCDLQRGMWRSVPPVPAQLVARNGTGAAGHHPVLSGRHVHISVARHQHDRAHGGSFNCCRWPYRRRVFTQR